MTLTVVRENEDTGTRWAWNFTVGEDWRMHFASFRIYLAGQDKPAGVWKAVDVSETNTLAAPSPPTTEIVNEALEIMRTRIALAFDVAP